MRGGFGFALVMAQDPYCCAPRSYTARAASRSSADVEEKHGSLVDLPCAGGWVRSPPRKISMGSFVRSFAGIIGGDGLRRCQVKPEIQGNSANGRRRREDYGRIGAARRVFRL